MRQKLLVVDDDPDLRTALAARLELEGFAVQEAEDGLAALAAAEALVPIWSSST